MLDEIACLLGTDKSTRSRLPATDDGFDARPLQGHGYTIYYEYYFASRRNDPVNLLEIGVLDGKSLATWHEYFPNGRLHGLDLDPACARFEGDRTRIFIGSQSDKDVLANVCRQVPEGFDIIIDDGSHYVKHIIASFRGLFDALRPGGLYIIEDIHVCTRTDWGRMAHNRGMAMQQEAGGNDVHEMVAFLQSVRDRPDVRELTLYLKKICFIEKKRSQEAASPSWLRGDLLESLIPEVPPKASLKSRIKARLFGAN